MGSTRHATAARSTYTTHVPRQAAAGEVRTHAPWLRMKAKTEAQVLAFAGPTSESTVVDLNHNGFMRWTHRRHIYNELTRLADTTAVLYFDGDGDVCPTCGSRTDRNLKPPAGVAASELPAR